MCRACHLSPLSNTNHGCPNSRFTERLCRRGRWEMTCRGLRHQSIALESPEARATDRLHTTIFIRGLVVNMRRRKFIQVVGSSLASVSTPAAIAANASPEADQPTAQPTTGENSCTVSGGGIAVEISNQGKIVGVTLGRKKIKRALQGYTALAQCEMKGPLTSAKLPNGGLEFRTPLSFQRGYRAATLIERFLPTTDSVRWEIDIECGATRLPWPPFSDTEPWSTAIETHLRWPEAKSAKFWTAWGDDLSSKVVEAMDSSGMGWTDPTVPQSFH